MLKKISIVLLASFFLLSNVHAKPAQPIAKDLQYKVLIKERAPAKEVVYFFSFNCPDCYKHDVDIKFTEQLEKELPKNVPIKRYHHSTFKHLAKELSDAWAVASVLKIEDKILPKIYDHIMVQKNLKRVKDIYKIFAEEGVSTKEYKNLLATNEDVKKFIQEQEQAQIELNPIYIPTVYVNGKYFVNDRNLDDTSEEATTRDYIRVIKHLVKK